MARSELVDKLEVYSIPEPNSGCLLWIGAAGPDGYGRMRWAGRTCTAHRLSWMARHGREIPKGALICHKCDVRACINPDHLFVGDYKANAADMVAKGRQQRVQGEDKERAKLTESNVREIRACSHISLRQFATRLGVNWTTVRRVRSGKAWAHVT